VRCLSCTKDVPATTMTQIVGLFLCPSCGVMAEKAEAEINQELAKAKVASMNWLQHHILKQGLLRGGSGFEPRKKTPSKPDILPKFRADHREVIDG